MSRIVFIRTLLELPVRHFSGQIQNFSRRSKSWEAFAIGFLIYLLIAPSSALATNNSTLNLGEVVVGFKTPTGPLVYYENVCAAYGVPFTIESSSFGGTDPGDLSLNTAAGLVDPCSDNLELDGSGNCYDPLNSCFYYFLFQPTSYGARNAAFTVQANLGNLSPDTLEGTGGIILANGKPAQGANFPIVAGSNGQYEAPAQVNFSATGVSSNQTEVASQF